MLFENRSLDNVLGYLYGPGSGVMSHTTRVSPVSGIPARLADQAKASVSVAGVSRCLPRPDWFVSKSVS